MQQSRRLNLVKAICIVLMVIGHAEPPTGLVGFIYLFHMPAFFFLSGYLLKDLYFDQPVVFIKKRLGSLYAPYVFWELVFLMLSWVFFRLHLADSVPTGREALSQAVKFITFRGHQPLLNGYWFLKTLFFCSIGCLFLLKFVKQGRIWLIPALVAAAGLCALIPYDTTMISRLLMAAAFYITGFLAARIKIEAKVPYAVAALAIVAVISLFWRGNIFTDGWGVLLYFPVALLGIYGIFGLATALDRYDRTAMALDFIGRATLTILTFHFLAFRIAALLKPGDWVLNTLFGIAFPLLIYGLYVRCGHLSGSRSTTIKLF